jgi:hypothetical protein
MTILQFQQSVADLLAAVPALATAQCKCHPENLGDIEARITADLAQLGLSCLVATPEIEIAEGNTMLVNSLSVVFAEDPLINRSRSGYMSALDAAAHAAPALAESNAAPSRISQREDSGLILVTLQCSIGFQVSLT